MKNLKLRYYLRGLGIGMLVTAIILGMTHKEAAMTDAEIRERALELGMVDPNSIVLSELQGDNTEEQRTEETVESTGEPTEETVEETTEETAEETIEETLEETIEETMEETPEETVSESVEETVEESTEEITEESEESPETVTITIQSGASSYTVSKDLAAAGLIEDARDYDTYLCDNEYSRRIRIGTYEIPVGADEEEIAKIITGKR